LPSDSKTNTAITGATAYPSRWLPKTEFKIYTSPLAALETKIEEAIA